MLLSIHSPLSLQKFFGSDPLNTNDPKSDAIYHNLRITKREKNASYPVFSAQDNIPNW